MSLPNGMSRFCASSSCCSTNRPLNIRRPFSHHLLHKSTMAARQYSILAQLNLDAAELGPGNNIGSSLQTSLPDVLVRSPGQPITRECKQPASTKQSSTKNAHQLSPLLEFMSRLVFDGKEHVISAIADFLFKPTKDTNIYFEGNFAPVEEIGRRIPVAVTSGALPADFPSGVYIRNGPNPQHGTQHMSSLFGRVNFLWVEGDGMLHATYFDPGGKISYQNKYIETEGYKLEKKRGKRLWLNTVEGDPKAISMCYLLNQLRFGKVNKRTCNTAVYSHAGRVFVVVEADLPLEINISDLSVVREWNGEGEWSMPFTSHPKLIRDTNEMAIFGFSPIKPYYMTGIISADGERLIHKCDLELERCTFSHEVCITERYNLILDWPVTVDIDRMMNGKDLICFEQDTYARVGVMPRYGDAKSVQWFDVEIGYSFHVVNSYEEGDEVVLHACRSRRPFFPSSKPKMDKVEWFRRSITFTPPDVAKDPAVDGVVYTHVHEWRFNLQTGVVVETNLTGDLFSLDMPKINERYVGYKNKYAYGDVLDLDASKAAGQPKYGRLAKLHLTEHVRCYCFMLHSCAKFQLDVIWIILEWQGQNSIKVEFHDPGPSVYFSEPQFVGRAGSKEEEEEDDGWIVTYIHDEKCDKSELYIIDAQKFSDPPIARIHLPQRVPYGFHGSFIHGAT